MPLSSKKIKLISSTSIVFGLILIFQNCQKPPQPTQEQTLTYIDLLKKNSLFHVGGSLIISLSTYDPNTQTTIAPAEDRSVYLSRYSANPINGFANMSSSSYDVKTKTWTSATNPMSQIRSIDANPVLTPDGWKAGILSNLNTQLLDDISFTITPKEPYSNLFKLYYQLSSIEMPKGEVLQYFRENDFGIQGFEFLQKPTLPSQEIKFGPNDLIYNSMTELIEGPYILQDWSSTEPGNNCITKTPHNTNLCANKADLDAGSLYIPADENENGDPLYVQLRTDHKIDVYTETVNYSNGIPSITYVKNEALSGQGEWSVKKPFSNSEEQIVVFKTPALQDSISGGNEMFLAEYEGSLFIGIHPLPTSYIQSDLTGPLTDKMAEMMSKYPLNLQPLQSENQ